MYSPEPEQFITNCSNTVVTGIGSTTCGPITKASTDVAVYTIRYYTDVKSFNRHLLTRWKPIFVANVNTTLMYSMNSTSQLHVSLKPANVDVYEEELYSMVLLLRNDSQVLYTLSFSYTRSTLLGPPYSTECFNYKAVGLESQAHCYENCVLSTSDSNNIWSTMIFTRNDLDSKPIAAMVSNYDCQKEIVEHDQFNDTCDLMIRKECRRICGHKDCIKEIFEVKIEGVMYIVDDEPIIQIKVISPNSLSSIITYIPQISAVDYITYVLSCLSFWLGVSPLQLLLQFDYEYVKQKFKRFIMPAKTMHNKIVQQNVSKKVVAIPNPPKLNIYQIHQQTIMQITKMYINFDGLRSEMRSHRALKTRRFDALRDEVRSLRASTDIRFAKLNVI